MNYFQRIADKHINHAFERVVDALNQILETNKSTTAQVATLAASRPTIQQVQQQLQAGGQAPLNVTSLPGNVPTGTTSVYETAGLTSEMLVLGGGGALVQSLGSSGLDHQVLHGATAGGPPTFAAVDLTLDVSGILPVANGGTNANTAAAALTSLGAAASGGVGVHTITLAKLTPVGTNGSITWNADGCVTSFVDPT